MPRLPKTSKYRLIGREDRTTIGFFRCDRCLGTGVVFSAGGVTGVSGVSDTGIEFSTGVTGATGVSIFVLFPASLIGAPPSSVSSAFSPPPVCFD